MASFIIEGGHRLQGEITPQGAKNEVLQILCATLLTSKKVVVNNVPDILDVNNLITMLQAMGPLRVLNYTCHILILWYTLHHSKYDFRFPPRHKDILSYDSWYRHKSNFQIHDL